MRVFHPCRKCGAADQSYLEYEEHVWQLHCIPCSKTEEISIEDAAKILGLDPVKLQRKFEEARMSSTSRIV